MVTWEPVSGHGAPHPVTILLWREPKGLYATHTCRYNEIASIRLTYKTFQCLVQEPDGDLVATDMIRLVPLYSAGFVL